MGIYLVKTKILIKKDTCTPIFTAILFTKAKTWKQPKHPYTDTHTHTHKHNGVLLSHKETEIMPFAATWMDSEVKMLSEVRERNIYHLYAESKKVIQVNLFIKKIVSDIENKFMVTKGEGRDKLGILY